MASKAPGRSSKAMKIGLRIAGIIGLATGAMAWFQMEQERRIDEEDLNRRAHVLAHQVSETVRSALTRPDPGTGRALEKDVQGHGRLIGFAVFRPDGRMVVAGKGVSEFAAELEAPIARALRGKVEVAETIRSHDAVVHILAYPVADADGRRAC